jgi:hypothetical protein
MRYRFIEVFDDRDIDARLIPEILFLFFVIGDMLGWPVTLRQPEVLQIRLGNDVMSLRCGFSAAVPVRHTSIVQGALRYGDTATDARTRSTTAVLRNA